MMSRRGMPCDHVGWFNFYVRLYEKKPTEEVAILAMYYHFLTLKDQDAPDRDKLPG